jgi:hypothetical protein
MPRYEEAGADRQLRVIAGEGMVTVRWSFRRAKLLRVGQRETKRRHFRVFIDGAPYRDRCVAEWRKTEETQHLADIAEGKDRPPQPNT